MKARLLFLLAVGHLGIMATALFPKMAHGSLGRFLGAYSRLTEAGANFGFFSPNVANQLEIHFVVKEEGLAPRQVELQDTVTSEALIRVKNMFRFFTQAYQYPRIRRSIAASLVTPVFRKSPSIREVTFDARFFNLPRMKEFNDGQGVQETEVYRVTFSHP